MTTQGMYCYTTIPFGLKNVGSTYQRLVHIMFKGQIGDTMEVYIDDIVVKSLHAADHVKHLEITYDIFQFFNMKLNLAKCNFGMSFCTLLGYMVTKRGIEVCP